MDKPEIGLPQGFSIKVQKPVEIGDYLDETVSVAPGVTAKGEAKPPPLATKTATPHTIQNRNAQGEHVRQISLAPQSVSKPKRKPRRQINMSPETVEKFNEIIAYVQDFGPQSDAAASEIMEAIINAHHGAISMLRLGSVRPRGPWGSPTADAFRHSLSRAFAKAILDLHST